MFYDGYYVYTLHRYDELHTIMHLVTFYVDVDGVDWITGINCVLWWW